MCGGSTKIDPMEDGLSVEAETSASFTGRPTFRVAGKTAEAGSTLIGIELDGRRFSSRKPKTSAAGRISGLVGCRGFSAELSSEV